MEYFAVQVWTGHEQDFAARLAANPLFEDCLLVPKRALNIRRAGKIRREERPIFSGYVFLASPDPQLDTDRRWILKASPHFVRILPSTVEPKPIGERDRRLVAHFMSFGKAADTSKVTFDGNDRIVVLEGPLKGLEGMIIKVDKRKRRAKVQLDMCRNSFLIDLSFEVMAAPEKGPGTGG